ncbi:hypothetical protein LEP1GSC188_0002 [Leptospira weilii serovar Topaz str. LT2116]|uniref:Uncharacterized protein n=1 Tax=Leptospira weilii serovar Topaz str. LT2116 TaxID=1088540 RepID=M3GVC1_9LEPT|nr:hypothetical protein LEP1GSC188_0002 [Leptospira weilii serovar Topaz str. LT2116]
MISEYTDLLNKEKIQKYECNRERFPTVEERNGNKQEK